MTKVEPDLVCPHCGAVSKAYTQFCPSCDRRLTVLRPDSRLRRILRALRFIKPADSMGQDPAATLEVYKLTPMNHSEMH